MVGTTYTLLLNGVDVSANFVQDSWSVTQAFGRQGSTATLYLADDFGVSGTPSVIPQALQNIKLTDTVLSQVLYAGTAKIPILNPVSPTYNEWQLDCLDYTDYLDNIIVSGDFIAQSGDAIVRSLIAQNNFASSPTNTRGLLSTSVLPAPTLGRVQINYTTLSTALTKLARLASQSSDYAWFVDYGYNLHFFSYAQAPAPVVTFTDDNVSVPTATLGRYTSDQFAYEWDGGSIRNSVIVRGANYIGSRTDVFVGDGGATSWPLTYVLDTSIVPTLSVNNTSITSLQIITSANTVIATTTEFTIIQNATGAWFLVSLIGPVALGQKISLSYKYVAPIITRVDNMTSQALYTPASGPNNFGVFQMAVSDSTLTSLSAVTARGNAELQAFQWPQERVTFTTAEGWPGHVNAGDTILLRLSRVPNSQAGFSTTPWTGTFLIVSNTYSGVAGNYRRYVITATRVA